MGHKIAVRVKPLKKWSDVANATRHGKREDPARHVDRSRTHLNHHYGWMLNADGKPVLRKQNEPVNIEEAFKALAAHHGAKWRKGAIVGTELLFVASPEFFTEVGEPGSAEYLAHARKWAVSCAAEVKKRYPDMVAAIRVDLDEKTPHVLVFMLPTYEKQTAPRLQKDGTRAKPRAARKTISHNTLFGGTGDEGPKKMTALQDWAAECMAERGYALERGTPKENKGPDHLTPAEGRRRIAQAAEAEQIANDALEAARGAQEAAERLLARAEADAKQMIEEARVRAETNYTERYRDKMWKSFVEIMKSAVRTVFGEDGYKRLQAEVRKNWENHPDNPDRPAPTRSLGL